MAGGDSVDGTALRFLVKKALERQKEEQRRKAQEERRLEATALLAVPVALRTPAQQRRIMELSDEVVAETHPKRRKRKKSRKKKLPHGFSSCGRARRQRQCLLGCSLFPSVGDWPQMLGIMASIDQKDSIPRLWCAHRRLRQWHVQGLFSRLSSSRCIPSCRQAKMLGILAGMDQRDSYSALVLVTAVVCAWLVFQVMLLALFSLLIVGRPVLPGITELLDRVVRCPFSR